MKEYTTKDLAEVLHALADVWEDFAKYCESQAEEAAKNLLDI